MKAKVKWINRILNMACWGVIAISIFTLAIASSYTVLVSDDYSHATSIGVFGANVFTYFVASVKYAAYKFMTWQGTYFSMFLQALLSPLNGGGMLQLRIVMVGNVLLFFGAFILLAWTIIKRFDKKSQTVKFAILAILVFMVTGYTAYSEVFFWYSGATSYSFPLALLMLAFVCVLKYVEEKKRGFYVAALVLGILAMGGSLVVVGTGCYALLLFYLYLFLQDRKLEWQSFVMFGVWFVGALANAVAPGNFARYDMVDTTGVHPIKGVLNSIEVTGQRYSVFFMTTNFVVLALCLFACGILLGKSYAFKKRGAVLGCVCLGLLTPVVSAFPLTLGYSSDILPERCAFVVDVAIIISVACFMIVCGILLENKLGAERKVLIGIAVACCALTIIDNYSIRDIKQLQIAKEVVNGTYGDHYVAYEQFMERMDAYNDGADVVLTTEEIPYQINNLYNYYMSTDPEDWINTAVAEYYGLGSVTLVTE